MRAVLATSVLLLSVAGCAVAPSAGSGPSNPYRMLRAYINPPTSSGPAFYVNRPAYVAMFEVVPGRGASLMYPTPGRGRLDGFVYSGVNGFHWNDRFHARHARDFYLPAAGYGSYSMPRYYFLIASEHPLDLDQFGAFGMGMHSALGIHFASGSAYNTMERIADLALPSAVDDGSWTSDLYVHWPEAIHSRAGRGRVLLTCNGYRMYVSMEYVAAVQDMICRSERPKELQQRRDSTAAPDGEVVEPRRRRPVPRSTDARAELRERVTSSTQLEQARRRQALDEAEERSRIHREAIRQAGGGEGLRERPRPQPSATVGGEKRAAPRATGAPRSAPSGTAERSRPASGSAPRARPERPTPSASPRPAPSSGGQSGGGESESRRPAPGGSGGS